MTSKRCGAKTKDGKKCRSWAMTNGKCRLHGGLSPAGIASPLFKHGRYSKVLGINLAQRYNAALSDPELLSIREDISLVDVRNQILLEQIEKENPTALWPAVLVKFKSVKAASPGGNKRYMNALAELEAIIQTGYNDYVAWQEVISNLEMRRKLVESEEKRLIAMQQAITSERALLMIARVIDVIRQNVSDRAILSAITNDLRAVFSEGANQGH